MVVLAKRFTKTPIYAGLLLACTVGLTACGSDDNNNSTATSNSGTTGGTWQTGTTGDVSIKFAAYNGTEKIDCTSTTKLGTKQRAVQIEDFRFYISNVSLIKADGTREALKLKQANDYNYTSNDGKNTVSLIDLEQKGVGECDGSAATNAVIKGTVPAGSYTGVEMTLHNLLLDKFTLSLGGILNYNTAVAGKVAFYPAVNVSYRPTYNLSLDVVVLVFGDLDFVPLIRKLNGLGTRVMVVAVNLEGSAKTSQKLMDEASYTLMLSEKINVQTNPKVEELFR